MSWVYRRLIRPALFAQDSERIHNFTINGLGQISRRPWACAALKAFLGAPDMPVSLWGLRFPNPIGLAAGMDKEAEALAAWQAMGFGFSELGAVTWHAQPGNEKPRVFRAIKDEALINRMGFNNPGAEVIAARLAECRARGRWPDHPVGMNLGKSKITPLERAAEDYAKSLQVLWPHLDFFVVNVSSPNTPNLRQLQDRAALDEILAALQEVNAGLFIRSRKPGGSEAGSPDPSPESTGTKPILVKIAPDLTFEAIDEILGLVEPRQVAGIVATNTTLARPETNDERLRQVYREAGGLSGKPLRTRSTEVIRFLARRTEGKLPIVGVGGIFTADDAWEKITAGATLLQVYTGMVYEGPGIVKRIINGLSRKLEQAGLKTLEQAVGIDHRGVNQCY